MIRLVSNCQFGTGLVFKSAMGPVNGFTFAFIIQAAHFPRKFEEVVQGLFDRKRRRKILKGTGEYQPLILFIVSAVTWVLRS
jgi:hypothetical protein